VDEEEEMALDRSVPGDPWRAEPKGPTRLADRSVSPAMSPVETAVANHVRAILAAIGEDLNREGLRDTPRRVARMLGDLMAGLGHDPADALTVEFHTGYSGVVMVRQIPFYSVCEHHLLPFFGWVDVAYDPEGGVVTGLSKLARVVELASRRPQLQERLTAQVADAIDRRLHPRGVWVRVRAEHLCMAMRGVAKPGAQTVTVAASGTLYNGLPASWGLGTATFPPAAGGLSE
jgi:GTP cyclohydrolase I